MREQIPNSGKDTSAQTVGRALDLLALVAHAGRPLTLVELARQTGTGVSSTYRRMQALESRGLVAREPDGRRYVVGGGLIALSAVVSQGNAPTDIARPFVEKIVALTSETGAFHVRFLHERISVYAQEGAHLVRRVVTIGERVPLYTGPTGKVIMAYLPEDEQKRLRDMAIDHGADKARLNADLKFAQENGYLAKVGDRNPGLGGIATPVFGANGIVGALSASGPDDRWSETAMQAASSGMKQIAFDLSVELGAPEDCLARFGIGGQLN